MQLAIGEKDIFLKEMQASSGELNESVRFQCTILSMQVKELLISSEYADKTARALIQSMSRYNLSH